MSVKERVFVVDDDEAVRDSIGMLLETVDISYVTYPDGQSFLDGVDPSEVSCLVLDIRMPGMSGLELLDRIQEALSCDADNRGQAADVESVKEQIAELTPREREVFKKGSQRPGQQGGCDRIGDQRAHGGNSSQQRHAEDPFSLLGRSGALADKDRSVANRGLIWLA